MLTALALLLAAFLKVNGYISRAVAALAGFFITYGFSANFYLSFGFGLLALFCAFMFTTTDAQPELEDEENIS